MKAEYSRKHYNLVAGMIHQSRVNIPPTPAKAAETASAVLDVLALNFAEKFAADNPRFDRDRFIQATWNR